MNNHQAASVREHWSDGGMERVNLGNNTKPSSYLT